jgi:hypothetical protein
VAVYTDPTGELTVDDPAFEQPDARSLIGLGCSLVLVDHAADNPPSLRSSRPPATGSSAPRCLHHRHLRSQLPGFRYDLPGSSSYTADPVSGIPVHDDVRAAEALRDQVVALDRPEDGRARSRPADVALGQQDPVVGVE